MHLQKNLIFLISSIFIYIYIYTLFESFVEAQFQLKRIPKPAFASYNLEKRKYGKERINIENTKEEYEREEQEGFQVLAKRFAAKGLHH